MKFFDQDIDIGSTTQGLEQRLADLRSFDMGACFELPLNENEQQELIALEILEKIKTPWHTLIREFPNGQS